MTAPPSPPSDTDVAIIGMALRVPGADSLDAFWRALQDGVEGITRFTDEALAAAGVPQSRRQDARYVPAKGVLSDVRGFDAALFGLSMREAALMDPQHRLFLECAWTALEHAGCRPDSVDGSVGVYAGAGTPMYLLHNLMGNPRVGDSASAFEIMLANSGDALTTRASYLLDLQGPSVNVQTACSTSLVAVHLAVQALLNGECRVALAGGVSVDLPEGQGYVYEEGMILSPDGHCRPFDAGARGTVPGSGVGAVVLKRLADALAEGNTVHAVIKGSAINNDGRHKVGFTAPSADGQAAVIAEALQVAGITPDSVGYIETHGTATALGDPIEVGALARVFGASAQPCALGSVKSNIGHLNTAAGVVGLIKAALTVRDGRIVPTLHYEQPNPQLALAQTPFRIPSTLEAWTRPGPRRAGVSSFGIGGTNAHVVLEQPQAQPARALRAAGPQVLPLSARSPQALDELARQLADQLELHPGLELADVAHTLQHGRRVLAHRRAVVAADIADAVAQLRTSPASAPSGPAAAWCEGADVDWDRLPGARIVALPTYPFERQPCWIEAPVAGSGAPAADPLAMPARTGDLADWFYLPCWEEIAPSRVNVPTGAVLLLADAPGVCAQLAQRLTEAGHTVVMVAAGAGFQRDGAAGYTVRPDAGADFQALFAELARAGTRPATIVHAFALSVPPGAPAQPQQLLAALEGEQSRGLHSLIALVQALAQRPADEAVRLFVAVAHAQDVLDDRLLQPAQATLLGAARIVSQEHANIACRIVDVDLAAGMQAPAAALERELRGDGPDAVLWRGGRRFVERYRPAAVPAVDAAVRRGGHYLVTGGLGGMGLAFAEALAEQGAGALLLLGRSVFPPAQDWDDWLREHGTAGGEAGRVCATIRRLQALQARGVRLQVAAADVADVDRMRDVLREARAASGPLHGVLHAAGVADYEGVMRGRSREQTQRTIAAKVDGTLVLDLLTQDDPLDHFLLCSSLGTVLYQVKFGQVGYAAANEFIDHYARARRARGGRGKTVAINWADWRESGMSVAALARWAQRRHLEHVTPDAEGLSDAEGREVMLRALGQDAPRVAVSQHDLEVLIRQNPERARAFVGDAAATSARPDIGKPYTAPRDATERRIAATWQKLLGLERVGVDDDFYELGGHSLLATQVVLRVNEALGVQVALDDFLDEPTVAAQAALVRRTQAGASGQAAAATPLARRAPDAPLPLSFAQERLWFLHQLEADPAAYNMPMALLLDGPLDRAALERALGTIVSRHEVLRTTIAENGGSARQLVRPLQPLPLPLRTWPDDLPAADREAAALAAAEDEARTPFDLVHGLPIRARLLQLAAQRHVLLVTQHHIASDGWSVGVLLRELGALYASYRDGRPDPLPPLPLQYGDYTLWQREQLSGDRLRAETEWWRERLDGLPDLRLPLDFSRPAQRSGHGATESQVLPAALCARLDALARAEGATRFMVLLAAFCVLLQRYSGQDDFAVGSPIANRMRPELEPLVGFFANTLVLRAPLAGDPSFRELVQRMRATAQGAYAHQDLPFEKLVDALDAAGDAGGSPLFQVAFVLQNAPSAPPRLEGLEASYLVAGTATAKFDLTLSLVPDDDRLHAVFEYATDLFLPETVAALAAHYAQLLANLLAAPDAPASDAPLDAGDAAGALP